MPYICIIIGCLRLIQIVLGNHVTGIVILLQGCILPILRVVQGCLRIDHLFLCRGDGQFGICNCFWRSHLSQVLLGSDKVGFQGTLGQGCKTQAAQDIPCFDLVPRLDLYNSNGTGVLPCQNGSLVGTDGSCCTDRGGQSYPSQLERSGTGLSPGCYCVYCMIKNSDHCNHTHRNYKNIQVLARVFFGSLDCLFISNFLHQLIYITS